MKYFKLEELGATSENFFHTGFLEKLDFLREKVNKPFYVTSCARSFQRNRLVGGALRSLHVYDVPAYHELGQKGCMAVDIKIQNPQFKVLLIETALLYGWSVGINDKKNFVHLDRRIDLGLPKAIFSY